MTKALLTIGICSLALFTAFFVVESACSADESTTPAAAATTTANPAPPTVGPPISLTEKRSVIDEDPRLKRTVTLVMRDKTISQLLSKLTELTAVKLTATSSVKSRKVTVIARGAPVVTIMAEVGRLFDWGWQRVTAKDEITYKLQPRAGLMRRAQLTRDRIVNMAMDQAAASDWEKTQPILDAWLASGRDMDVLNSSNPTAAQAIQGDPAMAYKLDALTATPPYQRRQWIVNQLRLENEIRGPDVAYGIVKDYYAARIGATSTSDPELATKVNAKLPDGAALSAALEIFSKASHFSVVADIYDRKTSVDAEDFKQAAISVIADAIANDTGYEWTRSGAFLRFRNRTWFLDELRTVPEDVAKRFKELKEKNGRLTFHDYVDLVSSLTDDQLSGLAESGDRFGLAEEGAMALRHLPYFRFFVGLNQGQRTAIWQPGGISMVQMTRAQQDAFLRLMSLQRPLTPPYWAPGVFFYARQRSSLGYDVVFAFNIEGRLRWEYRLSLPRPQSEEPPPTEEATPELTAGTLPSADGTETPPPSDGGPGNPPPPEGGEPPPP